MLTSLGETRREAEVFDPSLESLPERYRESLARTIQIADSVGPELRVHMVEDINSVPPEPGVYLFNEQIHTELPRDIIGARFVLDAKTLSGKLDSAHAVLPGLLSVLYQDPVGKMTESHAYVAAKGYYKREFGDRFERVIKEVQDSYQQNIWGEIAFEPLAVIVAPPEYKGKRTDDTEYDLLLVTRLDGTATTLDNMPWQTGFDKGNLESAESAIRALGRFNTRVGMHGDAKIKNIAQRPDGLTSMIDFETGQGIAWSEPASVATAIHEDLGKLFNSLRGAGFFGREPARASEVLNQLGEAYLEYWEGFPSEVQDAACNEVVSVVEACVTDQAVSRK